MAVEDLLTFLLRIPFLIFWLMGTFKVLSLIISARIKLAMGKGQTSKLGVMVRRLPVRQSNNLRYYDYTYITLHALNAFLISIVTLMYH